MMLNPMTYLWPVLFLSLFGCTQPLLESGLNWENGKVIVKVTQIKTDRHYANKSVVYGSLLFESVKQEGTKANMTCIAIQVDNIYSKEINIDSYASTFPAAYSLKKGDNYFPVYWSIDMKYDPGIKMHHFRSFIKDGCVPY